MLMIPFSTRSCHLLFKWTFSNSTQTQHPFMSIHGTSERIKISFRFHSICNKPINISYIWLTNLLYFSVPIPTTTFMLSLFITAGWKSQIEAPLWERLLFLISKTIMLTQVTQRHSWAIISLLLVPNTYISQQFQKPMVLWNIELIEWLPHNIYVWESITIIIQRHTGIVSDVWKKCFQFFLIMTHMEYHLGRSKPNLSWVNITVIIRNCSSIAFSRFFDNGKWQG